MFLDNSSFDLLRRTTAAMQTARLTSEAVNPVLRIASRPARRALVVAHRCRSAFGTMSGHEDDMILARAAQPSMRILFGHPTGNPNSYNAALAYLEAGLLECFCVTW